MNLQRISEFAENQEGKAFLLVKRAGKPVWLTSGSFRPGRLCEPHHFE